MSKKFIPPTREECISALCLEDIPKTLQSYPQFFSGIPKPKKNDWLSTHDEKRENYDMWFSNYTPKQGVVYLQPINNISIPLDKLVEFVGLFYPNTTITTLPTLFIQNKTITVTKQTTRRQTSTTLTLRWRHCHAYDTEKVTKKQHEQGQYSIPSLITVLRRVMPRDTKYIIGVTMEDLYHTKTDSFAVGIAMRNMGIGIFSFHRYTPPISDNNRASILLQRSCKVLVHELAHLFGMLHCVWYTCCMNGSTTLEEDYKQPLHFCPVCLRKLQNITGCDLKERYINLLRFYTENSFLLEAKWQKELLALL